MYSGSQTDESYFGTRGVRGRLICGATEPPILRFLKRGMEDIGEDRGGLFEKETDASDIGKATLRLYYSYSRLEHRRDGIERLRY